jgi:hypothetical protein
LLQSLFQKPNHFFWLFLTQRQATLYTNATITESDDDDTDGEDDGDYIIVRIITAVPEHYLHSTGHQDLIALLLLMRKTAYPNHERLTENFLDITQLLPCTSFPVLIFIIITELLAPQPELYISKTSFQFCTPGYLAHRPCCYVFRFRMFTSVQGYPYLRVSGMRKRPSRPLKPTVYFHSSSNSSNFQNRQLYEDQYIDKHCSTL